MINLGVKYDLNQLTKKELSIIKRGQKVGLVVGIGCGIVFGILIGSILQYFFTLL